MGVDFKRSVWYNVVVIISLEINMDSTKTAKALPSVMALSFLGDSRHSLYVRKKLVEQGISKSKELNEESLKYVTCEKQALMYEKISTVLTEEEASVFKRAFNSGHLNKPKRASGKEYRTATGFEAVIGLLEWQGNGERLEYLLDLAHEEIKNDTQG